MARIQATICERFHLCRLCTHRAEPYCSGIGESCELPESDVQQFVLQKLANGISVKTIKDILIVLKR